MQPSSQETCSWPHVEGRNGHEAGSTFALFPHLFKRLKKGSFLLSGAALTCQACVPWAASFPTALSSKPAAVPSQPREAHAGCPAHSLIRLFQPLTWLKLDSHLRSTTLQTPTKGPPSVGCANWNTNQRKKLSSVWTNCYRFTPVSGQSPRWEIFSLADC